ncbi:MAG: alkaline phosphatase family protein [Geminicoccaceae bacterium]
MNLSTIPAARPRRAWRRLLDAVPVLLAIAAAAFWLGGTDAAAPAKAQTPEGRTIVIGFDGMDPGLAEAWMNEGFLPNFAKLRQQGHFQPLPTTNPAQSPVAWASFATGLNPGAHGIFDFLSRNSQTYGPDYSIASVTPAKQFQLFGMQIPLDSGSITNKRVGTPFWVSAERDGHPASVLRVPVTYPPDPISRMLSGMGVPDMLGTQGTFTIYTTDEVTPETTGGRQIQVKPVNGRVEVGFDGPPDPFWVDPTPMSVPVVIEQADGGKAKIEFDGTPVELAPGAWSDWVSLKFTFGGFMHARGIVRLFLVEGFPNLKLYVSPIQIDPRAPVVPISSPPEYAADLASRIGLFHTIGMPEETWALNEGQMTDDGWLDMEETILHEREKMFFDTLAQNDSKLIVQVFVQTDRTSHMFWRGIDEQHPLHNQTSERGKGAVRWIYGEADRILGKTMAEMRPDDRLIVLSDHGFAPWRWSVNLNRWLVDNGFMATKPGQPTSEQLFGNVNWTKTQAYAIGLNDIYLNRRGREGLGIVREDQIKEVKQDIIAKLSNAKDPATGEPFMLTVYDTAEIYDGKMMADAPDLVVGYAPGYRASWQTALGGVPEKLVVPNDRRWSGDHCIEPSKVPGILFTSFPVDQPVASIQAVPKLIRASMGGAAPAVAAELAPSHGWLDFAAPALSAVDRGALGWLPVWVRILLWAALASFISMGIYRLTSRQDALAEVKEKVATTRVELQGFDGEFAELWPILKRNLGLAGKQLWLTFVPAMIASLPVLFILAWMSNAFDASAPAPGATVPVTLTAAAGHPLPPVSWQGDAKAHETEPGTWEVSWPAPGQSLQLVDSDGSTLLTLPTAAPVRTVHQREWWNSLIGNPGGYLPKPGDVSAVSIGLPQPTVIPFGPDWLRGWIPAALIVLVVLSLFLKFHWRLH